MSDDAPRTSDLDLGEDITDLGAAGGHSPFDAAQLAQLQSKLDPHMGSRMKTGGRKKNERGQWEDEKASYLETNVVIDQANAIFGFGNWGYELIREDFEVDNPDLPRHSGVYYAWVRVTVRGCEPTVELGAQPMKIGHDKHDDGSLTPKEANGAQRRMARQGAVSAGLKRGLRHFGNQFGNSLYSKDSEIHALIEQAEREDQQAQRQPAPRPAPPARTVTTPAGAVTTAPRANDDPFNVHAEVREEVRQRAAEGVVTLATERDGTYSLNGVRLEADGTTFFKELRRAPDMAELGIAWMAVNDAKATLGPQRIAVLTLYKNQRKGELETPTPATV